MILIFYVDNTLVRITRMGCIGWSDNLISTEVGVELLGGDCIHDIDISNRRGQVPDISLEGLYTLYLLGGA